MSRIFTPVLFSFLVLAGGPARAQPAYQELNRVLTEQIAVPAYTHMAAAMRGLDTTTAAYCQTPGTDRWTAVLESFHAAMDAWQRAQPIAFGPVTWDGRAARIEFWPDDRGVAARQVRLALQAQDPDLVAEGGLQGKSVALQNLATFERILFGTLKAVASGENTAADRYACGFAAAIARFQAGLAAKILDDWVKPGGFREAVLNATAGNEHFLDAGEAAVAFLKSLSGTLDLAIRLKLEPPLGESVETARPERAESWRSGRSLENPVANLETVRALYAVPGSFGDLLKAAGAGALDIGMRKDFDTAVDLARSIPVPLHLAVADQAARGQLEALLEKLKSLRVLVSGPLADEIGLVVGFNALDGD